MMCIISMLCHISQAQALRGWGWVRTDDHLFDIATTSFPGPRKSVVALVSPPVVSGPGQPPVITLLSNAKPTLQLVLNPSVSLLNEGIDYYYNNYCSTICIWLGYCSTVFGLARNKLGRART